MDDQNRQVAAGDKVVCIDATPLPNFAPRDADIDEFTFPDGFIEEGAIYCIENVFEYRPEIYGYYLVGIRLLCGTQEYGWCSGRFRKIEPQRESRELTESREIVGIDDNQG
ncbi:MAG: hypothetical protein P1V20_23860 [Verrucomicrobiales bacterium]|nr:hypothetical protein [Verrucomicrobiales bacterium]